VLDMVGSDGKPLHGVIDALYNKQGVYILYRGDVAYYIGLTEKSLYKRICVHNKPGDDYYSCWDCFSVIVVSAGESIKKVEDILIASIPTTANRAEPRGRIPLPEEVVKFLKKDQIIDTTLDA